MNADEHGLAACGGNLTPCPLSARGEGNGTPCGRRGEEARRRIAVRRHRVVGQEQAPAERVAAVVRERGAAQRALVELVAATAFAALTALGARVQVHLPFTPVPVTGQTFGVMLAGLVLGPWWGAASMLVYLAIGALGFPVFAGGRAGLGTLSGPAGGYLIGFVLGAWITGFIARSHGFTRRHGSGGRRKPAPWLYLVAALCGGVVVVHTAGSLWLALSTGRTAGEAFALGSAPFLPGDLLKALGAVAVAARLYEATGSPWTRWR